jgi:hypothetical protein
MQNENQIIHAGESIITVPIETEPTVPPQYWGTETGLLLALAVFIRAVALLVQTLTPLILRDPETKDNAQ